MSSNFNKEQATQVAKNRRQELKRLSQLIKPKVSSGEFNSINEALLHFYRGDSGTALSFNTFDQWRRQNCMVKKGEQSFLLWGAPKPFKKRDDQCDDDQPETFFPICHIFSEKQVEKQLTNSRGGGGQSHE